MPPTQARDRAQQLATRDTAAALEVARRINDPWCACQALAWVARYAPDERVTAIAEEALKAGRKSDDPYQAVASAAWPLRALVERGHSDRLASILRGLQTLAGRMENSANQCEALLLLFQAVFPAGRRCWRVVFDDLVGRAVRADHWRAARALRDAVLIAAGEDVEFARASAARLTNAKLRGQIERRLDQSKFLPARPFFWSNR